jgi:hypothetical protein
MIFVPYVHLEKFGNEEVIDINLGKCYIFPKIDGTNSSIWMDEDGNIAFGSRTRRLTLENDNQGFMASMINDPRVLKFFTECPHLRLYGEWLVPHTLETYREDSWRKFYVFDVTVREENAVEFAAIQSDIPVQECGERFVPYIDYQPLMEKYGFEYIRPQAVGFQPSLEQLVKELEKNTYLIKDGCGVGEGIVIKNYGFYNKWNRQVWAKIVRNEFKEQNRDAFGIQELMGEKLIEKEIVDKFLTTPMIEKVYAKIVNSLEGWNSKKIPDLLNLVFYDLVKEEMWEVLKVLNNPTVNFKTLRALTVEKIKEVKKDLFLRR